MKSLDNGVQPKLTRRINLLRWWAPLLAFLLVLTHQVVEHTWLSGLSRWPHFTTQLLFYGLVGPTLAWWALTSLYRRARESEQAHQALSQANIALEEANQRLEFLIRVNRRLVEAEDDDTLLEIILALPLEVVPALGCSLIRFDERGQPLPAIHQGKVNVELLESWATHLTTPTVQNACRQCTAHWATQISPCPLLKTLPLALQNSRVYCLNLIRGSRKFGVLNIYLPASAPLLTDMAKTLLATMADEISLALESHHFRSRELATLYRLQQARHLSNLRTELADVLDHLVEGLEIEGGSLFVTEINTDDLNLLAEGGQPLPLKRALVQKLAGSAQQTEAPLVFGDFQQDGNDGDSPGSLLIAPLTGQERFLGSLILWSSRPKTFSRWRTRLVTTVAQQMALLIENHRLYAQLEQQAALAERARLAREIHDGLAQSLAYLKLRSARMTRWLASGEIERVAAGLEEMRTLLTKTYQDAREAIDDLRLKPTLDAPHGWLAQVLVDFQSLTSIQIEAGPPPDLQLPLEVQAQLLRITQEALSNIRKYAAATHVGVDWQLNEHWLTLRITDNGRGFDPEDVLPTSRHGLKIMQERAELLDADFQIISQPGAGAQVIVRLPLDQLQQVP